MSDGKIPDRSGGIGSMLDILSNPIVAISIFAYFLLSCLVTEAAQRRYEDYSPKVGVICFFFGGAILILTILCLIVSSIFKSIIRAFTGNKK